MAIATRLAFCVVRSSDFAIAGLPTFTCYPTDGPNILGSERTSFRVQFFQFDSSLFRET